MELCRCGHFTEPALTTVLVSSEMLPIPFRSMEAPMLSRRLPRRCLAGAVAIVATGLTLAVPQPASAATGTGASAYVSTRVDDPTDALRRLGNVHLVSVGVDANPEGDQVSGEVTSYNCEPGAPLSACDRVALNRLVANGPVTIKVRSDGSADFSVSVAEVRFRDGRQLRTFDVDLNVEPGDLTSRGNCTCGFSAPDGTTYTQAKFIKQWTGASASGTIGVYPVVAGAATVGMSGKYWVKSSVPV